MVVFKRNRIHHSLTTKGFEVDRNKKKHLNYIFVFNGKKTEIHTWVSHGMRQIDDRMIGIMANQVDLQKSEFEKLIECPLKKEGLIQIYLGKKKIP